MNCDDRDGLSLEDLAWDYPMMSECPSLGHPVVKLPDGERFADYHFCLCGEYSLDWEGVKRRNPEQSDYL